MMITVSSYSQNHDPVTVRDTASTLAEVPVIVNVLLNDYDPDGDTIKFTFQPGQSMGSPREYQILWCNIPHIIIQDLILSVIQSEIITVTFMGDLIL